MTIIHFCVLTRLNIDDATVSDCLCCINWDDRTIYCSIICWHLFAFEKRGKDRDERGDRKRLLNKAFEINSKANCNWKQIFFEPINQHWMYTKSIYVNMNLCYFKTDKKTLFSFSARIILALCMHSMLWKILWDKSLMSSSFPSTY